MRDLIQRLRGGGETYGLALDGKEISAVLLRSLSGGRTQIESAPTGKTKSWLTSRKEISFVLRHARVPADYSGPIGKYIRAFAEDIFPMKGDPIFARTDEIRDPDGVTFVHGITQKRHRELLKDFFAAGIDPRMASGLVPQSIALHRAVHLLEQRPSPIFLIILHLGHTGVDIVGIRGDRPVFHRPIYRSGLGGQTDQAQGHGSLLDRAVQRMPTGAKNPAQQESLDSDEEGQFLPLHQQIMRTVQYLEKQTHFGLPDEVVITGPGANIPTVVDDTRVFFPKSQVRLLEVSPKIVSEGLSHEDIRANALAIGAAAVGRNRRESKKINFLVEPGYESESPRETSVYDKIILGCAAAMLALAFVTANAFFLDLTKSRLSKIAENQKTIESLREQLRVLEPDLESATRFLNTAGMRFDSYRSKTFSIPASVTKLLSAIEAAAPDGVTLDKIESGSTAGAAQGRYSNFFAQGEPVSIVLSGRAEMPEHVIFFQDALRNELGVSVDVDSMGREGDAWSRKPVNFVIVLRGSIRRA